MNDTAGNTQTKDSKKPGPPSANHLILQFGLETSANLFGHLQPQVILLMYVAEALARMNRMNPATSPSDRRECVDIETTLKAFRRELTDDKKSTKWLDEAIEGLKSQVDEELEKRSAGSSRREPESD